MQGRHLLIEPEKKGACRGHKGVQDWYDDSAATKEMSPQPNSRSTPVPTSERAPAPPPSTTAMPRGTPATTPAMAGKTSGPPSTEPAAGGGAGKVWTNTSTKVYHCQGDKYYGTTKHGEYMSESDAKSKGFHADHGKACA